MTQVSHEDVSERIKDWASRLNDLYDKLDEWLASIPHDRVKRDTRKQAIEPPMRRFDVRPRDLPTYTIFKGRHRIEFVPSALWVPGTNGRVDVTTKTKEHILVDRAENGHGSNWQLVTDDFDHPLVPFNKTQLRRFLQEGGE